MFRDVAQLRRGFLIPPLSFSVRSAILFMQCQALLLASAVSFPTSVGYDDLMAADARLEMCFYKARYIDSAEHCSRLDALHFTAMDWIFIPAHCFALP